MRLSAALSALALFGACLLAPSEIQVRPVSVRKVRHELVSALEIDIPADSTLHVALADREDVLDVERSKKAAQHLIFEAKAGERITITARAHEHSGGDVLKNFVEPLGGAAAVDAITAAVPTFSRSSVITVDTAIDGPGRSALGTFSFPAPHHMAEQFNPSGILAPEAPLRILQWVMSTNSGMPGTALQGSSLVTTQGGRPVSEQPAPIWTLWLQVKPSTATR